MGGREVRSSDAVRMVMGKDALRRKRRSRRKKKNGGGKEEEWRRWRRRW